MSTQNQISANRESASKSHGPVTESGKFAREFAIPAPEADDEAA